VGDGYLVEAAIPWSVLGVTPYGGLSMGFALSISDNDAAGQALHKRSFEQWAAETDQPHHLGCVDPRN